MNFNDTQAKTYIKNQLTKAFPFTVEDGDVYFSCDSTYLSEANLDLVVTGDVAKFFWDGWDQGIKKEGVLLTGVDDEGNPGGSIWGCAQTEFEESYEYVDGDICRKSAQIRAYQPGCDFETQTVTKDGNVEVEKNTGGPNDWLVRSIGADENDTYIIKEAKFEELKYTEVD